MINSTEKTDDSANLTTISVVNDSPINNENLNNIYESLNENTLLISETKGKIFLPFSKSILNDKLANNSESYSNIEEIIEKEYVLPYNTFKNIATSRFKEAYKLMRNKEKKSIASALNLGFELIFNYNLHPAIISACKNLDELDIYLDYLEDNETDKFDCFKIIFEIAPVLLKCKH